MIDKLIKFAKENHAGFAGVGEQYLRSMFERYKETTLVNVGPDGEVRGFGIYQEWPDCLNFIALVGNPEHNTFKNFLALMKGRENLPHKKIVFFDEEKMELRELCRP